MVPVQNAEICLVRCLWCAMLLWVNTTNVFALILLHQLLLLSTICLYYIKYKIYTIYFSIRLFWTLLDNFRASLRKSTKLDSVLSKKIPSEVFLFMSLIHVHLLQLLTYCNSISTFLLCVFYLLCFPLYPSLFLSCLLLDQQSFLLNEYILFLIF